MRHKKGRDTPVRSALSPPPAAGSGQRPACAPGLLALPGEVLPPLKSTSWVRRGTTEPLLLLEDFCLSFFFFFKSSCEPSKSEVKLSTIYFTAEH